MCGIAGFLTASPHDEDCIRILSAMTDRLSHRGPDGSGLWNDPEAGIGLGHRRLAVIDLSPAGRQPMVSASGRFVITFNGEIYNHHALRAQLPAGGQALRGRSDTEVLLEAIAAWGVEATLPRLVGMFAFALWDRADRVLILARDQMGIKPLYWSRQADGLLLFGSELKALQAHPAFEADLDTDALSAFFRFGYVPSPRSIFRATYKLPPGCCARIRPGDEPEIRPFWSAADAAAAGASRRRSAAEPLADELEALLRNSVRQQMEADVPLGGFLSGGVDSSLVIALMQAESGRPVRTYSIGFPDRSHDEAPFARAVAQHLGTDHTECYVDPRMALDLVPKLPELYDEPFSDASQLPTTILCSMARHDLTVALSGDGGDELFGGYTHYQLLPRMWQAIRYMPARLRGGLGAACLGAATPVLARFGSDGAPGRVPLADRLLRSVQLLAARSDEDLYRRRYTHWEDPDALVPGAQEFRGAFWNDARVRVPGFLDRMQLIDQLTYLPDNGLAKVDRASMSVGLEVRVPLLDHRVTEFAWTLPEEARAGVGGTKCLLREVLYRHVPRSLIDRPKAGFNVPLRAWLTGPLRDWANDLLAPARLRAQGILEPKLARLPWERVEAGAARPWDHYLVWDVLVFQSWASRQRAALA